VLRRHSAFVNGALRRRSFVFLQELEGVQEALIDHGAVLPWGRVLAGEPLSLDKPEPGDLGQVSVVSGVYDPAHG
jgi:hypothetical protein